MPGPQENLLALLQRAPVVPVLRIDRIKDAVPLARALVAGGLPAIEVTLRTPAALDAISRIAGEVEGAIVGAGTILAVADHAAAIRAGARFIVSPGATSALFDAAEDSGVPFLPGAITPSEMMAAAERGYEILKFFPAEQAGGAAFLKALASPLKRIRFCPTGGITAARAPDYLGLANVVCIGGSWVAPEDRVKAGDWGAIEALSREASAMTRG